MSRRHSLRLTLLASIAAVATACGGTPAAPELTDPVDILVRSAESLQGVKSFRADLALSGSINIDLMGSGATSAFPLDNTTATAEVDTAGGNARLTFAAPGILGLSGELIQIGSTTYVKTSLTGSQYSKEESAGDLPTDAVEFSDDDLEEMRTALAKPELAPTKGDDIACGDKTCYAVVFDLTSAELAALGADDLPTDELPADISQASISMTVRVEKDTLRPAGVTVTADLGSEGSIELDITLSRWDEAFSISAPPDAEVAQ